MKKKKSIEEVMEQINKICEENDYNFLGFDNEENEYKNNSTHLILHCNKCGTTWKTASYDKFVRAGRRCPGCNTRVFRKENVIKKIEERCKELDYTFLGFVDKEVKNRGAKLVLKCNKCGTVWDSTTINNFLRKDRTSHKCERKNPSSMPSLYRIKGTIEKLQKKLEGTSLEFVGIDGEYIGFSKSYVLLKCKKCGEIMSCSLQHLFHNKNICCRICEFNGKKNADEVIGEIKKKCKIMNYEFLGFNNEKNRYKDVFTPLVLKCNDCGFIWKTTTYSNFMSFQIKCINCKNNWHMEKTIKYYLTKNNIEYEFQKRFDWLKNKISLSLDFYLPKYNIAIECQGRQHFTPVDKFGGINGFEGTLERDKIKKDLCEKNGVKLLYFCELKKYDTFLGEKLIKNEKDLLSIIYGKEN